MSSFIDWLKKVLGCEEEKFREEILLLEERIETLKKMVNQEEFEEPKILGTISNIEINSLLKPYCDDVHCSDRVYGLTSVTEAKEYSETTKVSINKWKSEEFDCDEFSFALMGYWNLDLYQFAFGIAWSDWHAFNIMIDNNKQIWIIEPQSNKFMKIEDIKYPFSPLKVVMI